MDYYVDADGNSLGYFNYDPGIPGAQRVPPPDDARDRWDGAQWIPSPEAARDRFKSQRAEAVSQITVTIDGGMVFDGDERSQERMARAITALAADETTLWVLADNTAVTVTREQLRAALRAAGQTQTELWVMPS